MMSTKQHTLFCATVLVVFIVQWTTAAPLQNVRSARSLLQKMTCLHKDEVNWKTCDRGPKDERPRFTYPGLNLPVALSHSAIPAMEVPVNSFKCFYVKRYSIEKNIGTPTCPALCKLDDPKEKDCEIDNLLQSGFVNSQGISVAKSPRYGCSKYFKSEICIYNISMPCKDSHIKISDEGSEIDMAEGDSVEIIDYKKHNVYQSITGSDKSLLQNIPIHTSDFLVLFLSERDSTQGDGFKLQFECPVIINEDNENNDDNVGSGSGSGSGTE